MEKIEIEDIREEHFIPKWVLNGFPKSGLHWVSLMLMPVAKPQIGEHEIWSEPWAGTFRGNSWTASLVPPERVMYKIGRLQDGYFFKSHNAYSDELERFLYYLGVACVFIYRDFRDIVVSQAFHVTSEDDTRWAHPQKDLYKNMDSFEEVMRSVIVGIDKYPGVMERWEYYSGWLDVEWICKLRFEELAEDTNAAAKKIIRHGLGRAASIFGLKPNVIEENLDIMADWMVSAGRMTEKSATFREGKAGKWREYFTPELGRLLAETDKNGWLMRLGYAEEADWWKDLHSTQ
jgi:hypothetical protein